MQVFKNSRTALATAMTGAALLGAASVAALTIVFDDSASTAAPPQVTVTNAAAAASSSTETVGDIYKRSRRLGGRDHRHLGGPGEPRWAGPAARSRRPGSGFVYDTQGHVVTNQHVVDGAQSVSVKFANGRTYSAKVVGADPSTDLAVIDVDAPASALKPLELGDSSAVEVGDGVIAIGSPFGLDQTVTTGIVSALHRQITSPNNFSIDDAIQTDAAINHGNSGGPLLDMHGDVIGVNSQIESDSGGNDGVGFAVPSNTISQIVGSPDRQRLGRARLPRRRDRRLRRPPPARRLAEVRAGTPAARAGLKNGDVITKFGDQSVGSADELRRLVDSKQPGDQVEVTVKRNGKTKTVTVTLGTRPSA